jgi:hypothetical protein
MDDGDIVVFGRELWACRTSIQRFQYTCPLISIDNNITISRSHKLIKIV